MRTSLEPLVLAHEEGILGQRDCFTSIVAPNYERIDPRSQVVQHRRDIRLNLKILSRISPGGGGDPGHRFQSVGEGFPRRTASRDVRV